MTTWDNVQYLKFGDERTRPARELLARVPLSHPRRIVDLGCGPGNSTALLQERWPDAHVTGVDDSADMLRRARQDLPGIEFVLADARTWRPDEPVDLLYANAVLHWLPDHELLFPALFQAVRPGGVLAVQMPRNFDEPSHRAMRETPGPWSKSVAAVHALTPVARPSFYYDLLAPRAAGVDIWQTTYEHVMADPAAIVEWVKGTGLRPYLDAVGEDQRPAYMTAYAAAIDRAYPLRADHRRLFSFPRLFLVAVR